MTAERCPNDRNCERPPGRFSKAQAHVHQRNLVDHPKNPTVRGFGRQMTGDAMIKRTWRLFFERRRRHRADETIENDGNRLDPCPDDGSCHGCHFTPAQSTKNLKRIVEGFPVPLQPLRDHRPLQFQTGVVDPSSPPDPSLGFTIVKGRGDCGGGGGVSDAHLAHNQRVASRL